MRTLQPTEYLYGSARIRALETHLVGQERVEALLDCKTSDEVMSRLAEYGIAPSEEAVATASRETRSALREAMLLDVLKNAYREVEHAAPEASLFQPFRYPYDCNNLKAAIKCQIRGIDPQDMLFDFGTVPTDTVVTSVREGNYTSFPPAMASAAVQAREAFAKSGDPRMIDTVIDRACYEDMLRDTRALDPSIADWVVAKIDLSNIMICLRILRMGRGEVGRLFLSETLLPGGSFDAKFYDSIYAEGEEALWQALSMSRYGRFVTAVKAGVDGEGEYPLAAVERCADDCYIEMVRESARVSFGAAVLGGYLVGCETAVKNIRIVLAAKDADLSVDVIRERIRKSYV